MIDREYVVTNAAVLAADALERWQAGSPLEPPGSPWWRFQYEYWVGALAFWQAQTEKVE